MCHLQARKIYQSKNAPVTSFQDILYSKRHFVKKSYIYVSARTDFKIRKTGKPSIFLELTTYHLRGAIYMVKGHVILIGFSGKIMIRFQTRQVTHVPRSPQAFFALLQVHFHVVSTLLSHVSQRYRSSLTV